MNPQYQVTLADSSTQEGLTTCNVVVSLIQEPTNRFRHQSENKYIGFTMYKVGQWFLIKSDAVDSVCLLIFSFAGICIVHYVVNVLCGLINFN